MTAVIYARYSSDNQREESIEGQIRECTAYAEKNGITVIKHYIDRAFSAKTDNRPEFQQMIKDSGKKLFDVVLVWKFDRFARNRFDSANYKMILKKNGVHLISVMEPIAEGSQGILVETLLEGMAEYYSAELSEKVIRGQTENALKGKCTGGTGTIGYKIDEDKFYHLDPLTSPLVLEAFQRYDNGEKMVEIVNFLNDKGVRNMQGGKMTHSSVNTMLKNRRYIGELQARPCLRQSRRRIPVDHQAVLRQVRCTDVRRKRNQCHWAHLLLLQVRQRQAAQGLQQKDRAERMAGRSGRPGDHEADSGRCGDRQDRSTGHGCTESGEHNDPAAGKATARGQQKAGQPDEGHRGWLVHPDNERASGSAGNSER